MSTESVITVIIAGTLLMTLLMTGTKLLSSPTDHVPKHRQKLGKRSWLTLRAWLKRKPVLKTKPPSTVASRAIEEIYRPLVLEQLKKKSFLDMEK